MYLIKEPPFEDNEVHKITHRRPMKYDFVEFRN